MPKSALTHAEPITVPLDLKRRAVLGATLASGFALAVQPVTAQTITTDTAGLSAELVQIKAGDTTIPGYRARPAGGGRAPVVLVVQEVFGVHEHIRDVCRRLAKLGYYAIAPELYHRQGDVSKLAIGDIISQVVSKVPDGQVMTDLDATFAFAAGEGADADKLAITGFCWGGRVVWLYAAHQPRLKAGIAWYGRVEGATSALTPKHPADLVADLKAPVLGLYGGADQGIPVPGVKALEEKAKAAGKKVEIVVYPETPHAFHADYRPSYRKDQADDGWKRLQAWLKQHGV